MWLSGPRAAEFAGHFGEDGRIHGGPVPASIRRRCQATVAVRGRAVLPRAGVADLLARAAAPGVARVRVEGADGAAVTVCASWAAYRARRWTTGAVRLADPADARRLGADVPVDAETVGMASVDPEVGLSW